MRRGHRDRAGDQGFPSRCMGPHVSDHFGCRDAPFDEGGDRRAPPATAVSWRRPAVGDPRFPDGAATPVGPLDFIVVFEGVLEGTTPEKTAVWARWRSSTSACCSAGRQPGDLTGSRILAKSAAVHPAPRTLDTDLETLKQRLDDLDEALEGNRSMRSLASPGNCGRWRVASMTDGADDGPTATHRRDRNRRRG